jgi:hypothetical protein
MTLADVIQAVARLSPEERRQLRDYLDRYGEAPKKNDFDAFMQALEAVREGLTEKEFSEIEQAMNAEYIEPLDDNL